MRLRREFRFCVIVNVGVIGNVPDYIHDHTHATFVLIPVQDPYWAKTKAETKYKTETEAETKILAIYPFIQKKLFFPSALPSA